MVTPIRLFAEMWGCNPSTLEGPDSSHVNYKLSTTSKIAKPFDGTVISIRLRFNGRWGNYVLQLIHIFHVALKLNVKRIFIVPTEVFKISGPVFIHGIIVDSVANATDDDGYQLDGVFFASQPLGNLTADLTASIRRELALQYVKPLLGVRSRRADVIAPHDLVIHIRSGDIFQGVDGDGGSQQGGRLYVQPPLAFYTKVVDAAFGKAKGHVVIVSENSLNPTIMPLVQALDSASHSVTLRLNHTLNSDLDYLLEGGKVVFGNGTIGIAIALLSDNITDGYFFRTDGTGTELHVDDYLGSFLRKHIVLDDDQSYIRKGDWRNNTDQRQLMTTYPIERLSWMGATPLLHNVARGKPTRQSSVSIYSRPNESDNAVNGNINGSFAFHTEFEDGPWWLVDLLQVYPIEKILVFNRTDYPTRAYSMQVLILQPNSEWVLVHDQGGTPFGATTSDPAVIRLNGVLAKAVKVKLASFDYLHLDEVEIYTFQLPA